jgi:hypothetical protein
MSSLHNPVLLDPVFLKAVVLGFCVAAPIGPVGLLCINRSLGGGALLGLATGLGASTVQVGWILLATAGTAGAVILAAPRVDGGGYPDRRGPPGVDGNSRHPTRRGGASG